MRMTENDNFFYLTFALVFLLFSSALVDQFASHLGQRLVPALTVITLAISVWSVKRHDIWYRSGIGMVAAIALVAVLGQYLESNGLALLHVAGIVVFFSLSIWRALRQVLFSGEITTNKILGAICVFLMLGIVWSLLYVIVADLVPTAFKDQAPLAWYDAFPRYIYFSFVTLTTLGFGDITPSEPIAQFLVYMEAVVGQLYIAVLVASLVGISVHKLTAEKQ